MITPARAARLSQPRHAPASPRRAPRRGLPFNRGRPTLLPLAKPPAASAEDPLLVSWVESGFCWSNEDGCKRGV